MNGTARFALYSSEDQTSKWVSVGQSFAGYAVAEFRSDPGVLVLKRENEVLQLRMATANIAATDSVPKAPATADAEGRASALAAARERVAATELEIKLLEEKLELLKKPIRDLPNREVATPQRNFP